MNPRVRRLIVSGVLVALVVIVLVAAMAQAARADAAGQTPAATAAPAAPASPSASAGTEEEAPATVNRSGTFLALGLALLLALVAAAVVYGRDRNPGEPASPGARRRIESPDSPDTTRPNPIVSAGGDRLSDGDPGQ